MKKVGQTTETGETRRKRGGWCVGRDLGISTITGKEKDINWKKKRKINTTRGSRDSYSREEEYAKIQGRENN